MKLTPAEDWDNVRWNHFEKGTSNVEFYRQIQADALRAIKSTVSQADDNCSGEQFKLWLVERLLIEANQLHPLPELPKVVTWLVEYEIPPLRAIYQCEVDHNSEQEAQEYVKALQPTWRIRKITLRQ